MLEKAIARVFKKALWSVDGKALAGWAAHDHVELAGFKVQFTAQCGCIDLLDGAGVSTGVGVVGSEGFYCPVIDIICVSANEAGTAEALGDATSPARKRSIVENWVGGST